MSDKKAKKFNQLLEESMTSGEFNKDESVDNETASLLEMSAKLSKTQHDSLQPDEQFSDSLKNELWQKMQEPEKKEEVAAKKELPHFSPWRRYAMAGSLALLVVAVGLGALVINQRSRLANESSISGVAQKIVDTTKQLAEGTARTIVPEAVEASLFSTWQEETVSVNPSVAPYTVKADLSNLINRDRFYLNDQAKKLMVKNSFVVQPGWYKEFFSLYENNRYQKFPSFITTDSVLHNYHLYFNYLLKNTEEEKLIPLLNDLTDLMLAESQSQYNSLKGIGWENAAKRNMAYFALAKKLLQPDYTVPGLVASEVERELALIEARDGIDISPTMTIGVASINPGTALKEDYSQYVPRGHYTRSDNLKRYFKAMMWYGRITFRLRSDEETKSAILITKTLSDNEAANSLWEKIYEPTNFFVGRSDDLNFYHYRSVLLAAYDNNLSLDNLAQNHDGFATFMEAAKDLDPPKLNSIPIFASSIKPDRENEIKGYRLMGQRYTIDSDIHQRLVCREVGNKDGEMNCPTPESESRMLPKGLDIPAAMGSARAEDILRNEGDFDFAKYPENMSSLKNYLAGISNDIWHQNLYWGWLSVLKTLLPVAGEGYPTFMTNQAWADKNLSTFLGSWTELRHDTILYVKQVYAEMGGGGPPASVDDRGYVEPNPYLYAKLAALTKMTKDGLDGRGLLSDKNRDNLSKLEELIQRLKVISEKELNGQALSDDDYEFIKGYGGSLEHFWLETFSEEEKAKDGSDLLNANPAALVADVATDPNGWVLEEAIGKIFTIYVAYPIDGQLRIGKGGIFSHYEFSWPLSDRLTDEAWREILEKGEAPDQSAWTGSFIAE